MSETSKTRKRMMRDRAGELVPVPENGVIPDGCSIVTPMTLADSDDDALLRSRLVDQKEQRFIFNDAAAAGTKPTEEQPIAKANELFARGSAEGLTSAQVSAVVVDAENALTALRRRVAALRAATLDPALDSDAVAWATSEAAAVDLEASRMEVCATRLRDRAKEIAADEADAPKWERYNAAKAARDAAEAAILAEYPALAEKIGNLLSRAKEADRLIGMANGHLPRDVKPLPWTHFLAQPAMIGPVLLPACGKDDRDHWPLPGHNTW